VTLRRLLGLGLVAIVLALVPVASGSPPDQTWIPGLYDDADFDNVILFITSSLGIFQPSLIFALRPAVLVLGLVSTMGTEQRPRLPLSSAFGRAPPLA